MNYEEWFLVTSISVLIGFLLFSFLMLHRNDLVSNARGRAIDIVHVAAQRRIASGDFTSAELWLLYESYGSYNDMMNDFRKWTFDQFFPGLEERTSA